MAAADDRPICFASFPLNSKPSCNMRASGHIVDLGRYPLHALDTHGADLITHVRRELDADGACVLPGFVTPLDIAVMVREAISLAPLAFPGPTEATPYFFNYDLAVADPVGQDHPLRRTTRRNLKQVAADLIPGSHRLSHLFHSDLMTDFLSRVLGQPVYRNADPYQSLNISIMEAGGCQQWHFDAGDMVTTLLLQEPEGGGVFEYFPGLRSSDNENFDQVRRVLDGDHSGVKRITLRAGALNLFRGHYSLHRVTEVRGSTPRLQAILGYTVKPNLKGSLKSSILHYGPRVAEKEGMSATAL